MSPGICCLHKVFTIWKEHKHKPLQEMYLRAMNLVHMLFLRFTGSIDTVYATSIVTCFDLNRLLSWLQGNALEDPWTEPTEDMFTRSVSPEAAPDSPTYIEVEFNKGDPVALNGQPLSPADMLTALNDVAGKNGIGRMDIVESRFVGMKSRGVYETPGGTILLTARRAIESITLDRAEMHLKVVILPHLTPE